MNGFSKTLLCFLLYFSLLGCKPKEDDKVTVTIKSVSQPDANIKISRYDNLDPVALIESKTDSLGNSTFEIPLREPTFATLQIGKKYGEVYLSPGYDLFVEEVGQAYQIPLKFSGKGAEINNYIGWVNSNYEKIRWAGGKGPLELDYAEFLHRFDSLKTVITDFHASYIDSVQLSDEMIATLEEKNRVKFSLATQEFNFYKLNNSMNEKWEAQSKGKEYLEATVPKEFENLKNNVPLDPKLLTDGFTDYQVLLNFYWHNKIDLPVSEQLRISKAAPELTPLLANALIKKGEYPEAIREFLIAFDLQYRLRSDGITPQTDSVFTDFQRSYRKSRYLPALTKDYNEWLAIAPGNPAPDLEGETPEGKTISLRDLRGKVVYIDVWATWCGPCVREIPASKKLQQEFANDDIEFLNVSIDDRKSDWEEFLQKDKTWKGRHVIIGSDKRKSFETAYKLFGVPDYILIDRNGNIVNMKAPRPSDEKIKTEIAQLLAKAF